MSVLFGGAEAGNVDDVAAQCVPFKGARNGGEAFSLGHLTIASVASTLSHCP